MTAAVFTRHRRALTITGIAILMMALGRFANGNVTLRAATWGIVPSGVEFGWLTILRCVFGFVFLLGVCWVLATATGAVRGIGGNGKASLGQGLIVSSAFWLASDKAELDWRAIRWTVGVVAGLFVVTYLPAWFWENSVYVGGVMLCAQVVGLLWTDLFTESPRWAGLVPFLAGDAPAAAAAPARGDYWRDARMIRRGWDKLVQNLLSKMEDLGARVKAPKLIGTPVVTERAITLVLEPPPQWTRDGVSQLAGILTNEWNGVQSQVREERAERMSRRRMRVDIAMLPLPASIAYPDGAGVAGGVPLGEDLMGNVMRLNMFASGYSHVLVAGQSGSGKTSGMRVIGLGLAGVVERLVCIDPKGAGELDGISPERSLFRPAEWRDWFDFLFEEQDRRAEVKREGGNPGRPIVTMIDELTQIATGMGARDKQTAKHLQEAHHSYARMIFTGRSVGIHIISGIQQASAEAMGGKMATAIRDQHLGRILFGRTASKENRAMVLGDRLLTPQDVENMQEAPAGRAWVSGMAPRDTGLVHCIQFYDVPEMGGVSGDSRARPMPAPTVPSVDDHEVSAPVVLDDRRALRDLVAEYVHEHGPTERTELCRLVAAQPVAVTTMRNVLRALEAAGVVRLVGGGGGNAPVVVHPAGDGPRVAHAGE